MVGNEKNYKNLNGSRKYLGCTQLRTYVDKSLTENDHWKKNLIFRNFDSMHRQSESFMENVWYHILNFDKPLISKWFIDIVCEGVIVGLLNIGHVLFFRKKEKLIWRTKFTVLKNGKFSIKWDMNQVVQMCWSF